MYLNRKDTAPEMFHKIHHQYQLTLSTNMFNKYSIKLKRDHNAILN